MEMINHTGAAKIQPGKYVKQSRLKAFWHQFSKNRGAVVGLIVIGIFVLIALFAPLIWDYQNDIIGMRVADRLQPPSAAHIFGTDYMGRDLFARVCYGARYSLLISLLVVTISFVFGVLVGAIAGYFGGNIEYYIMRVVEIFLMIPSFMLVVVFVSVFGVSLNNLIWSLGLVTVPHFVRTARASVMTVAGCEYVEAARALGASELHIILKYVIPNALSPSIVQATVRFGSAIIDAAAFSFLGLGVPSPLPEWGALLADGRAYMRQNPYLIIFPGIAIMISVLALNLAGDGLRDALDPKLKRWVGGYDSIQAGRKAEEHPQRKRDQAASRTRAEKRGARVYG